MKILKLILINLILLMLTILVMIDLSNTLYVENVKSGVGVTTQSFMLALLFTVFWIVFSNSLSLFKLNKNEILDKLNSIKKTKFSLVFMFLYIYIIFILGYILILFGLFELKEDKPLVDMFLNSFFGIISIFLIYKNLLTKITIRIVCRLINNN